MRRDNDTMTDLLDQVLEAAQSAGATAADAIFVQSTAAAASVRLRDVESVTMSSERRLGLRCFAGRASAVASTADLGTEAIGRFARDVVEMASIVAPDPHASLPPSEQLASDHPDLGLADQAGTSIAPEDRVDLARRCEGGALDADARITNSEGGNFSQSQSEVAYGSSAGFRGAYRATSYDLSASPIATEGSEMQSDYWYSSSRTFAALDEPGAVGKTAAARTLRKLGGRRVPTATLPVVFDPITAASLMRHLAGAACGGALYHRASFLLDKLGEQIAAPIVSVIDDGRLPGGLSSRPFDAEGLPTRRNLVVERGELKSYLLDSYSGRKLDLPSTGNAARSIGDVPGASPTNFHLKAGEHRPEEIIAAVDRGLYVTSLSGFGVNGVTGDYSRGAAGLWIENGELTHAVEEITIAGNLLEMFRNIQMIGNDLEFRSSICSPTLLIGQMTIAGG